MLALYLHHDHSVLTNIFCTQVLCADAVIGMGKFDWAWEKNRLCGKNMDLCENIHKTPHYKYILYLKGL